MTHPLGYPLTQWAKDHHLPATESASVVADDSGTVYEMNDQYLEVCDGRNANRGIIALVSTVLGGAAIAFTGMWLWMMMHIPHIYVERGQVKQAIVMVVLFAIVGAAFLGLMVVQFCKDCFSYTRYPIRLDRVKRMVYVFKKNGPNGTLRVPWGDVFFFIDGKLGGAGNYGIQYAIRGNVLDEGGRVVDTFTIGKWVSHLNEDEKFDRVMLGDLLSIFEFYRRYMEVGIGALPQVKIYIRTETSFKNSLLYAFRWVADWKDETSGFFRVLFALLLLLGAIPCFALSAFHFLAMTTSREPVWPEDVERAASLPQKQREGVTSMT